MRLDLTDMLLALSEALDKVEEDLIGVATGHGKRVAYLSCLMAKESGMTGEELEDFVGCAILHDNALTEFIREELGNSDDIKVRDVGRFMNNGGHCVHGEENMRLVPFRTDLTNIILYHHENADGTGPFGKQAEEIPLKAQILHVADLVDMRSHLGRITKREFAQLMRQIRKEAGSLFTKESVDLFRKAITFEALSEMQQKGAEQLLREMFPARFEEYSDEEIHRIAALFARIVDYKSSFTKDHSLGVAQKAQVMAVYYGYPQEKVTRYYFAAAFHDIGKLIIDNDILEKPGRLDAKEFSEMKNHAVATCRILGRIRGIDDIVKWAGHHHEKLDGQGYPFGLAADQLSFEERLMGCVDIYQALVETRSYKNGLSHREAIQIMDNMVKMGKIDGDIVRDIDKVFGD